MNGIVPARLGNPPKRGLKQHSLKDRTDEELLGLGEPFFLSGDPRVNRVPMVRLFGPGRYWRSIENGLGFDIVGEGVDLWANDDEMRVVLDERRVGICVGKWFSRWCPDGEFGSKPVMTLEPISETAYEDALHRIRAAASVVV